ncbi:MAG: transglutaminase, partial [Finegoldia magna]|nr:transglutaminase [Finegoldia magna]
MKKALKILLLLVFVFSLSACAKNNTQETKQEETKKEDTNKVEIKKEEKKEENFAERKGTLTTNVDLSKYEKGKSVKLWLPIPQDSEYQKITNVKVDLDEAHAKQQQTTDKLGN